MTELPNDQHITYQLQFRKCGKASCSTCHNSQGHGPYWYAYWRDGARLRSGYIGKISPTSSTPMTVVASVPFTPVAEVSEKAIAPIESPMLLAPALV
jgi:hypothetical protein